MRIGAENAESTSLLRLVSSSRNKNASAELDDRHFQRDDY